MTLEELEFIYEFVNIQKFNINFYKEYLKVIEILEREMSYKEKK